MLLSSFRVDKMTHAIFNKATERMRSMKLRLVELAAVCGIGLANMIGLLFNNDDVMSDFRDRIYEELHKDIAKNYGFAEIGPRIATLMMCLQDAEVSLIEDI
jgi:hypothetical protein